MISAEDLDPDWIARSLVAEFGAEAGPSFITKHEYQLEGAYGARVYGYKWMPASYENAASISAEIKKNGIEIQVPRDEIYGRAKDNEIIAGAKAIRQTMAAEVDLDPEDLNILYIASCLEAQRSVGHDDTHAKPMFQMVETIKIPSCDIVKDNRDFCVFPTDGSQAKIAYFPRNLPERESWTTTVDPTSGAKKAERVENNEQASITRLAGLKKMIKDQSEKNMKDSTVQAANMMKKGTQAIIEKRAWEEELINATAFTKDLPSPEKRKAIELAKKAAPIACESKIIFVNFPTYHTTSRRSGKRVAQSSEINLDLNEHMTIADLYQLLNRKYSERFALLQDPKFNHAEVSILLKTESSSKVRIYNEEAEELDEIITTHLGASPTILIAVDDNSEEARESIKKATRRITHPDENPSPDKKAKTEHRAASEEESSEVAELKQKIAELQKQKEGLIETHKNKALKIRQEKKREKELARTSTAPSISLSQSLSPQGASEASEKYPSDIPAGYYERVFKEMAEEQEKKKEEAAKAADKPEDGAESPKEDVHMTHQETGPPAEAKTISTCNTKYPIDNTTPPKVTPEAESPAKKPKADTPATGVSSPTTNLTARLEAVQGLGSLPPAQHQDTPGAPAPMEVEAQQEEQTQFPSTTV
jgi:hypothetical protein